MTREEALERIEFRIRRSCPESNGEIIGECDLCWRFPCNEMKAVLLLCDLKKEGESE